MKPEQPVMGLIHTGKIKQEDMALPTRVGKRSPVQQLHTMLNCNDSLPRVLKVYSFPITHMVRTQQKQLKN